VLDCVIASAVLCRTAGSRFRGVRMIWRTDRLLRSARRRLCRDLLELLAGVTDGRLGQGRDHPVAAVLALAAAAVVAGSRSFTAIAGWPADVPADVLESLYRRRGAHGQVPAAIEMHGHSPFSDSRHDIERP
jgi:hypothetical protein